MIAVPGYAAYDALSTWRQVVDSGLPHDPARLVTPQCVAVVALVAIVVIVLRFAARAVPR